MASTAEQLILRGLNLVIRTAFSPNEPVAQQKHYIALQNDIGPWLSDYAEEIAKPAIDWNVEFVKLQKENEGGGGLQS